MYNISLYSKTYQPISFILSVMGGFGGFFVLFCFEVAVVVVAFGILGN